jgi:hypothetical protein
MATNLTRGAVHQAGVEWEERGGKRRVAGMGEGHRSEGSSCKQASKQCKMGPRGKPQEWDLEDLDAHPNFTALVETLLKFFF